MLAKSRRVRIDGRTVSATPLLLPSYSSRALGSGEPGELRNTVRRTLEIIVGPVLISAYDLYRGAFEGVETRDGRPVFDSPLTFIDSGGYETLAEPDPKWTPKRHAETLSRWHQDAQAVMVGFDTNTMDIGAQITSAAGLLPNRSIGRELLLKLPLDARVGMEELVAGLYLHGEALARIDVVGVTEKEAGSSLQERLHTIGALRRTLDRMGLETPIHVFGGLDPVQTPLFFLAGADIFDGLSWLRYAYENGDARYLQAAAALDFPEEDVLEACWLVRRRNYSRVTDMQIAFQRYLVSGRPADLHPRGETFVKLMMEWGFPIAE